MNEPAAAPAIFKWAGAVSCRGLGRSVARLVAGPVNSIETRIAPRCFQSLNTSLAHFDPRRGGVCDDALNNAKC